MANTHGRHRRPTRTSKVVAASSTTAKGVVAAGAVAGGATVPGYHAAAAVAAPEPVTGPHQVIPTIHVSRETTENIVTIHAGDTLSAIAGKDCNNPADWTGIAARNKIPNPNVIYPGQKFTLSCTTANIQMPAPPPAPPVVHQAAASAVSGPDQDSDTSGSSGHIGAAVSAPAASVSVSGYGGFQACVIARESGGQVNVMNASGHYGLYQFSASTWAINGGNPATFGHASVAEQNQVFATAMSKPGGAQNWQPYDGC